MLSYMHITYFLDMIKYLQKLKFMILFVKAEFYRARPDMQSHADISGFVVLATVLYLNLSS